MEQCEYLTVDINCKCTYEPCVRKGKCCECVPYHRDMDEIPACFFPPDAEKTYDRSIRKFIEIKG